MSHSDVRNEFQKNPVALSPREAYAHIQDGAVIIDIRPEYETNYRVFGVHTVYLLSYSTYKEKFHEIPKEKRLIIADSVGLKSPEISKFFHDQGYPQVAYLAGGVVAWDKDGLPLIKDLRYELNGGCACMLRPKKVD
ncbi:rhodanese-like domain-containing protein [Alkaliphilus oremlandii]|uniref:Rhodanese domain protein n=1 Tax=Alkaliphilus oremlandii (strain OhILAs) TaxID=350688 RepID=A8MGW7_ALKOO|nr:rhodanese-like domain-containing protein [Alkaliphilus oremlandii]ABW18661.1 Rhodanese domain protein [Alkaliphilus oremlandii OhILAs]